MNILLGLTGSVATVLAPKIIAALKNELNANVKVILTDSAEHFYSWEMHLDVQIPVYTDEDEWIFGEPGQERDIYHKGDRVLHIALRDWADIFLIAPLTVNTMAKMVNGVCDNLLTSVYRAWNVRRPVIFAPAANTAMWENPITSEHVEKLQKRKNHIYIDPISKQLACGDFGCGALAEIGTIIECVRKTQNKMHWDFPISLRQCPGIPVGNHPGAFGAKRKHDRHCGVDLYCPEGTPVFAVEDGTVVLIEQFTGEAVGTPWWNSTWAVKVEGASGVVCYGEIKVGLLFVGEEIQKGDHIGNVVAVPPEKLRKDIPGHSVSMLHLQLYSAGKYHKDHTWENSQEVPPDGVKDPTELLRKAASSGCLSEEIIPLLEMK